MDIGFIGLGEMGSAMVGNLLKAGHAVRVWNRTAAKAQAAPAQPARKIPSRPLNLPFNTERTFTDQILTNGTASLSHATPTTVDGDQGWQGLLANCQNAGLPAPTVDCNKNPGVLQRGTLNSDGTRTTVIEVPAGFDSLRGLQ